MGDVKNLIDTLNRLHCQNAEQAHFSRSRAAQRRRSTMPVTSFVYELFLYNSLYQYDWEQSFDAEKLVVSSRDDSETVQQQKFEKFIKARCKDNSSMIKRAFEGLVAFDDLDGRWTRVTGDARITVEAGEKFFRDLALLQNWIQSREELPATKKRVFDPICNCRYFIYLVRNNIFHGTKTIGQMDDRNQKRRIEVYEAFLRSLVSLFFLAVGKNRVAADHGQLPICVPRPQGGVPLQIHCSNVLECVVEQTMKPEDSRLIRAFFSQREVLEDAPSPRAALFYPSAGKDVLTPLLLGLPFCSQFFFYDVSCRSPHTKPERLSGWKQMLRKVLKVPPADILRDEGGDSGEEATAAFVFDGVRRTLHLVGCDNREFLNRDVDLAFYFHRGDSVGEGGSGQEWDSRYLADLGQMVPGERVCQFLTDGEPGGLHPELGSELQIFPVASTRAERRYFVGQPSGASLRILTAKVPNLKS